VELFVEACDEVGNRAQTSVLRLTVKARPPAVAPKPAADYTSLLIGVAIGGSAGVVATAATSLILRRRRSQ